MFAPLSAPLSHKGRGSESLPPDYASSPSKLLIRFT